MAKVSYPDIDKMFEKMSADCANSDWGGTRPPAKKKTTKKSATKKTTTKKKTVKGKKK